MKPEKIILPKSWSSLTWQQLCRVWGVKMKYGGNANVARSAALLTLISDDDFYVGTCPPSDVTGEKMFLLKYGNGSAYKVTPLELSHIAAITLKWVDFPYGDPGEDEEKDKTGKVIKERREAHFGYVSNMRDAMFLPEETIVVVGHRVHACGKEKGFRLSKLRRLFSHHFSLPQLALSNLTWQQYRSLQAVAPQLFADGINEEQVIHLQAQFMAYILSPRSLALLDTNGGSIRIRPHWEYRYNAEQAEELVGYWQRLLLLSAKRHDDRQGDAATLFHILFQCYQTSISYYSKAYPLLFNGEDNNKEMRDALQGEVCTVNTIMKYAGYSEQQQVYDSNIPFVLDILNTMTKEAKEIEKANAKIRKK